VIHALKPSPVDFNDLDNGMEYTKNRCVLWVADKHSGKTTTATKLAKRIQQQGYTVGGILAPSIYKNGELVGFDIVDIRNNSRIPLAVRDEQRCDIGAYRYYQEGLELGHSALHFAESKSPHLVIVDEYGPWELEGKGWRFDVDCLLEKSYPPILLVVRRELADKVRRLYAGYVCFSLEALDPNSIDSMLFWLNDNTK